MLNATTRVATTLAAATLIATTGIAFAGPAHADKPCEHTIIVAAPSGDAENPNLVEVCVTAEVEAAVDTFTAQVNDLTTAYVQQSSDVDNLRAEVAAQHNTINRLHGVIARKDARIAQLRAVIRDLRSGSSSQ